MSHGYDVNIDEGYVNGYYESSDLGFDVAGTVGIFKEFIIQSCSGTEAVGIRRGEISI